MKHALALALILLGVPLAGAEEPTVVGATKSKTVVGYTVPIGCADHDPAWEGAACSRGCLQPSDDSLVLAGVNHEVFLLHGVDAEERKVLGAGQAVVVTGTFAWQGSLRTLAVESVRSPNDEGEYAAAEEADPEYEMHQYFMTFLRPGPAQEGISDEKRAELMVGHFGHISRQARAGKLLIAGPFGEQKPVREMSGIYIYRAADSAEADALTGEDPAVAAGYFVAQTLPWYGPKSLGY